MAAAPGGAAPPPPPASAAPPCACSNISIMQLFHELKQQFPAVPDHIVSSTISAHCHDRDACASRLRVEAERLLAAVHPARARHPPPPALHDARDAPKACPNRPDSPRSPHSPRSPETPPPQRRDGEPEPPGGRPAPKRPDSLPFAAAPPPDSFPLNVSVNLNCRVDAPEGGGVDSGRPVASPGSYTSLNLTVCTPTALDRRAVEEDPRRRGFEGRVQITLSSGPPRPTYPGDCPPRRRTAIDVPEQSPLSPIESLLRRQRQQFDRLRQAIRADYASIASIRREIRILQAPAPVSNNVLQRTVQQLRDNCQILYRQIEETPHSGQLLQGDDEIDDNLDVTNRHRPITDVPSRNPSEEAESSWECHVCTFLNHALLNKCEECDMPRIILVHADDEITVQLHPGCNKVSRSWIL